MFYYYLNLVYMMLLYLYSLEFYIFDVTIFMINYILHFMFSQLQENSSIQLNIGIYDL